MNFSIQDMFRHSFCITTSDSLYARFAGRMLGRDVPEDMIPQKFTGLYPKCIMQGKDNMQMCILSHFTLIHMASLMGWDHITIFEDDALPRKGFYTQMQDYLKDGIPNNPTVMMWGQLHYIDISQQVNNMKYARIVNGDLWGTQAYTIFKRGYDHYLQVNRSSENQINPDWESINFPDDAYATSKSFFIQYKDELQYPHFLQDKERLVEFI